MHFFSVHQGRRLIKVFTKLQKLKMCLCFKTNILAVKVCSFILYSTDYKYKTIVNSLKMENIIKIECFPKSYETVDLQQRTKLRACCVYLLGVS